MIPDLHNSIDRLNNLPEPILYRYELASLLARFGHVRVRQALCEAATGHGRNVVSIASASGWCELKLSRRTG
jgi:hypothetical protein